MKVKEFINSISEEEMDYELLIASDEEGNSYHTVDPEITGALVKDNMLQLETHGQHNALILTPYTEVEQE